MSEICARSSHELSIHELDGECAELLPGREALGALKFNFANFTVSNSSLALNAATMFSFASSSALQSISFNQS